MSYIFYCLLVILPIWQDSPLSGIMGSYGYSIVPLISIVVFVPFVILHARKRSFLSRTFANSWFLLVGFLVLVNFVAILLWVSTGGSYTLRGEDIVMKSIKGIVTAASIGAYLYIVTSLMREFEEERVVRPFAIAFLLLAVIAVVEYTQLPNALPFVHYAGIFPYNRMRFLTIESSWTTLIVIVYGGVSLHYFSKIRRSSVLLVLCLVSIVFMVVTTTSKSMLVMVAVAIVLVLLLQSKRDIRWVLILLGAVFFVVLNPSVFDRLQELFAADLDNYTSTATRSLANIAAFVYSLMFPLGTGNALYLYFFPDILQRLAEAVANMGIHLNLSEIYMYITSSDDFGMSAKSAILQYGLYWGIAGTILFVRAMIKTFCSCARDPRCSVILKSTFVLSAISVLAFMTFDSQYEFLTLMALLDYYSLTSISQRSNELRC